MDFHDFKLFPLEGNLVGLSQQEAIGKILENLGVLDHVPHGREVIVEVGRSVPSDQTLAAAHNEWRDTYFPKIATPAGLPRQPTDAKTPPGLVRVRISAIEKRTPGMDSHFGFEGYFLSLLISPSQRTIWDARGEAAK